LGNGLLAPASPIPLIFSGIRPMNRVRSRKKLLIALFSTLLFACIFHHPGISPANTGPFIDSTGYRAAQARLENIDLAEDNALISQALFVPDDSLQTAEQPAFFQSIEENYQRYLPLFTPVKKAAQPEIRCAYDLVETFSLLIFDPQPFINAMLHTMSLTALSTLDFTVKPKNTDTLLIHVAWAQAVSKEEVKGFSVSEGDLTLAVTKHNATLVTARP
jgi:hypothetical protein